MLPIAQPYPIRPCFFYAFPSYLCGRMLQAERKCSVPCFIVKKESVEEARSPVKHESESISSIDTQLDFILNSTQRRKPNRKKLMARRKRKTSEQISLLQNMMVKNEKLSKEEIKEFADKLGLSDIQVYKWFWDSRRKYVGDCKEIKDDIIAGKKTQM